MAAQMARVEVQLADGKQVANILVAARLLANALEHELAEPFTMTPATQERLQSKLDNLQYALNALARDDD